MAKAKSHSRPSTAKFLFKLGATLVGGAVLGEIVSPLTGPVSGPALGIVAIGLPVWGLKRSYLTHAVMPAVTIQALKTASSSKPVIAAKASLAGATRALQASGGTGAEDAALARARALSGR